jgi:hypothetical protein
VMLVSWLQNDIQKRLWGWYWRWCGRRYGWWSQVAHLVNSHGPGNLLNNGLKRCHVKPSYTSIPSFQNILCSLYLSWCSVIWAMWYPLSRRPWASHLPLSTPYALQGTKWVFQRTISSNITNYK